MPFNGRAIYSTGAFSAVKEDVSEQISMISPFETPFLDRLGFAENEAKSVYHEWMEEELSPNTVISSTNASSINTGVAVHVGGVAAAPWLQAGAVLKNQTTGEFLQITAISGNTLTVTRGFGGSTAADLIQGDVLFVVADAALEGADVVGDITRPRTRAGNYCQIFKKDIIVSETMMAVSQHGGIENEYAHQKANRMKEAIRDLEKATIQGKSSGNTLGSGSAFRTMKGVWDHITTNVTSTGTLTPDILDTIIQGAWTGGASDIDLIIADAQWKRAIDGFNSNRTQVVQGSGVDTNFKNRITQYESTFGTLDVMLGRWMPARTLMVVSTNRIKVVPLKGRSFTHQEVSRTGDAMKGMIVGEYTVEVKNEAGHAKAFG